MSAFWIYQYQIRTEILYISYVIADGVFVRSGSVVVGRLLIFWREVRVSGTCPTVDFWRENSTARRACSDPYVHYVVYVHPLIFGGGRVCLARA